jgi:hypothetical protein
LHFALNVMRLIDIYSALRDHFGPLHGPDALGDGGGRRVYSAQAGRESYLGSDAGCPLRGACAWYQARSAT